MLTDHHDFFFFPLIKEADDNELGEDGSPISDENKIVDFPAGPFRHTHQSISLRGNADGQESLLRTHPDDR
jgi:hypothetical protein